MVLMYLRKSRADDSQMTVSEVLAKHESILQDYCVQNYGKPLDESNIIREVVSGETIADRPGMQELLRRVTNEDLSGVLCVEPQRLTRGDLADCGTIIRVFRYSNTKIITPQKTFDLSLDYERKFVEMTLQQGNDYLEYTKAILKRGREQSQKRGNYIGSRNPYGYDRVRIDKRPTLVPNNEAPIVRLIFDLCSKGYGTELICNELTARGIKPPLSALWGEASVRQMLKNELYIGKITHGKYKTETFTDEYGNIVKKMRRQKTYEVYDGNHPAIVDEETFYRCQRILGSVSREPASKELKNPFASLLRCQCGKSMILRDKKFFFCQRKKYTHCPNVRYNEFTEAFIKALKADLNDFTVNTTSDANCTERAVVTALNADLAELEKQQVKLYELLEKGIYSEELFATRNTALDKERQRLLSAIENAKARADESDKAEAITLSLHQAIDSLNDDSISAKSKNTFLKGFIKEITYDGDVHITYR